MARRRNPENETTAEAIIRQRKEKISGIATTNDRIGWRRKFKDLKARIDTLKPFEERILEVMKERHTIDDEIKKIRDDLMKDCIHPVDFLLIDEGNAYFTCKFCERRLRILK